MTAGAWHETPPVGNGAECPYVPRADQYFWIGARLVIPGAGGTGTWTENANIQVSCVGFNEKINLLSLSHRTGVVAAGSAKEQRRGQQGCQVCRQRLHCWRHRKSPSQPNRKRVSLTLLASMLEHGIGISCMAGARTCVKTCTSKL